MSLMFLLVNMVTVIVWGNLGAIFVVIDFFSTELSF